MVGRESVVGIATRYDLNGWGIESWWGARFITPVQTGPGNHPASYTMGTRSLYPGRDVDQILPSRDQVKERVKASW